MKYGISAVLVETSKSTQSIIREILVEKGIKITGSFQDVDTALKNIKDCNAEVAILDVSIATAKGSLLYKELFKIKKDIIPIILFHKNNEDLLRILKTLRAKFFLLKDSVSEGLLNLLYLAVSEKVFNEYLKDQEKDISKIFEFKTTKDVPFNDLIQFKDLILFAFLKLNTLTGSVKTDIEKFERELSAIKADIQKSKVELTNIDLTLNALSQAKIKLTTTIETLLNEIKKNEGALIKFVEKIKEIDQELPKIDKEIKLQEQNIFYGEANKQKTQLKLTEIKERVEKSTSDALKLSEIKKKLENGSEKSIESLSKLETLLLTLKQKIDMVERKDKNDNTLLKNKQEESKKIAQQIAAFAVKIKRNDPGSQEQHKLLLELNEKIKIEMVKIEEQIKTNVDNVKKLIQKANEVSENKRLISDAYKEISGKIEAIKSTHARVSGQLNLAQTEAQKSEEEFVTATKSLNTFRIRKEELEKDFASKKAQLSKIEEERKIFDQNLKNAKASNDEIKIKLSEIEAKISSLVKKHDALEGLIYKKEENLGINESALKVCSVKAEELNFCKNFLKAKENDIELILNDQFYKKITVMVTDIKDSTSYFETFGDISGRRLIKTHNDILFPIIKSFGTIVKTNGDSITAYFDVPEKSVEAAIKIQRALAEHNNNAKDKKNEIHIRIGLHNGFGIIEQKGDELDLYGDVLYMTTKIEENTGKEVDNIIISGELFDLILNNDKFVLEFNKNIEIQGREHPLELFRLLWRYVE